jgi:uncharacterized protein involved in exopolysaccharide biosynthesis
LKRQFIFSTAAVFFALGCIVALSAKIEYIATAKLMPESQKSMSPDLGGLGGLAGLAGINLNMGGNASLSPELYPEIVRSSTFIDAMINAPLYFEKIDTTISSFNYFAALERPSLFEIILQYTIGLPAKIKNAFSPPSEETLSNFNLLRFSQRDWSIMREYSNRLTVKVNPKNGIVTIEAKMPDQVAAAQAANLLVTLLTQKITRYKIEKAEINLQFILERFQEAKTAYEVSQSTLAIYADRNRNISNGIIQTEYERLQNQLNINFEVYKGLATQLEQAKIQVKEETPVFTILEPVRIPVNRSAPNRKLIVFILTVSGFLIGLLTVMIRNGLKNV